MDRIKQAMEKARANKSHRSVKKDDPVSVTPIHPGVQHAEIEYDQTKVVRLDPRHLEANRIVALDQTDPRRIIFDMLRTQISRKMRENGWKTIAITSPTAGCGKTLMAINLAISMSQKTDQTALLVDFDLRRPSVGKQLGLPPGPSLVKYLNGNAQLTDILVNPNIRGLVVLPNSAPIPRSSEVLTDVKVENLVEEIRERYDSRVIIFDLPPILTTDDVLAFLPQVDCVLMVVANGMSTKSEIEESTRLLSTSNLIGTVLNKSEVALKGYYY
jgi:hypothetical protein